MTQEDKQLLLKDICARLPYGVKMYNTSFAEPQIHTLFGRVSDDEFLMLETYKSVGGEDYRRVTDDVHYTGYLESIKPYLRPMSSMTMEEVKYKLSKFFKVINTNIEGIGYVPTLNSGSAIKYINWLNENHFDYNNLIEKGLALEAPEGMYKIE